MGLLSIGLFFPLMGLFLRYWIGVHFYVLFITHYCISYKMPQFFVAGER